MKTKWIVACLAVLIAATLTGLWASRQPAKESAIVSPPPQHSAKTVPMPPVPVEMAVTLPDEPLQPVTVQPAPKPRKPIATQSQNQAVKPPKEPLHDPDARDALALVGIDPQAEDYWMDAIFDTSLPDKERDDLMEDLNEVGFSNPQNVTADDLPLIVNRLQIIDQVLPYADPFMTDHLLEAQKDLANMYAQAAQ